jgi:hypothetical protein
MSPSVLVALQIWRIGYIPFFKSVAESAAAASDDSRICYPQSALRLFGVYSGPQICKFTMRKLDGYGNLPMLALREILKELLSRA